MYVQFETNTLCNARCSFCPGPTMQKRKEMDSFLIQKIIEETVPYVTGALPFLYQEPFLERRLPWILSKIKETNSHCITSIYTNAGAMIPDKIRIVIDNLDEIFISFYGPTKELHEKYQSGLDWEQTKINIKELWKIRGRNTAPYITMYYINIPELMENIGGMNEIRKYVDAFGVVPYDTFCGEKEELIEYKEKERSACNRLWSGMNILANGVVVPCCLDFKGSVDLGNVKDENCMDIWNGRKMEELREIHLNKDLGRLPDLCKNCIVYKRDS